MSLKNHRRSGSKNKMPFDIEGNRDIMEDTQDASLEADIKNAFKKHGIRIEKMSISRGASEIWLLIERYKKE
jgi:hypothetical protein